MSENLEESTINNEEQKSQAVILSKREPDDLVEIDYYSNPEDEAISYLRQMLKVSKRKVRSKKIDNSGKVRWARAGIEASKILLYSGVIDRAERRKSQGDLNWLRLFTNELMKKKMEQENKVTV